MSYPLERQFNGVPDFIAVRGMMALGAGVRQGVVYDRPVQSVDLVPTLGAMMGFPHGFLKVIS